MHNQDDKFSLKHLILKMGSTLPELIASQGDFEDWTVHNMGLPRSAVRVINVAGDETLPAHNEVASVVITGAHAMVTEHHAWSERAATWLVGAVARKLPILGICYGHQLLAYALGGEVGDNPQGREFGTVNLTLTAAGHTDQLLKHIAHTKSNPSPATFKGHMAHTQSILRLPPKARVLATSAHEAYAAVAFTPTTWGVQFHPEFDSNVTCRYIVTYAELLRGEGQSPEALQVSVRETPKAATILRRFAELSRKKTYTNFKQGVK